MRVCILHNAVSDEAALDDQDVLVQVEAVARALGHLCHEQSVLPCTLNLESVRRELAAQQPDVVVNLVESLAGNDSLSHVAPAVLDAIGIPYTGNSAEATYLTAEKTLGKRWLRAAGLPTPDWITREPRDAFVNPQPVERPRTWILKGVWEQASRLLDDDAIVEGDAAEIRRQLAAREERFERPFFGEAFIAGREFNVALLAGRDGPRVLPSAEIEFAAYPPGKPRIVGYRAKWQEDSFEYRHTLRRFDFPSADGPLLDELADISLRCWEALGLRGYARVDFRVDESGHPWILEVNTNPCLSPDAGYAAALREAGIAFHQAVAAILDEALRHKRRPLSQPVAQS
ncbi:MAG: D-alanine--D-alanine ligase family protein [Planctomycetota bacterium]